MRRRKLSTLTSSLVILLFIAIVGLSITPIVAHSAFPGGDWWAIGRWDHTYSVIEDPNGLGSDYVEWRAFFSWDENLWPEDHWHCDGSDCYHGSYECLCNFCGCVSPCACEYFCEGANCKEYYDYWYFHEFRRLEYGGGNDKDVMDAIETYYTNLPPPHDISIEEYVWWIPDWADSDEELEVYTKEPPDIIVGKEYYIYTYYKQKSNYDDYRMQFESEYANHIESPPADWKKIEWADYDVQTEQIIAEGDPPGKGPAKDQREAPIIEVITKAHSLPYEIVYIQGAVDYGVVIKSYPVLSDKTRLDEYVKARIKLLLYMEETHQLDEEITAIISFNKLISAQEYISFVNEYRLSVDWFRYVSSEGGGKISVKETGGNLYPIRLIMSMEQSIKRELGSGFQLIEGIGAVKVKLKVGQLSIIQSHPDILLVDLGPLEEYIKYKDSASYVVMVWWDIFQDYYYKLASTI